jgi:protocatechuate 3,4-dioxygenase beta subunit
MFATMTRLRALIVIGLLGTAASGQSTRPPTVDVRPQTVRGRVVAARNGDPLPRARIAVAADDAAPDAVLTDDRGQFSIPLTRPTDLTLTITKAGYAATRVRVARKALLSDEPHTVRLEVGAAVSGRVAHQPGRPAVATPVTVRRDGAGEPSSGASPWVTETDDRGEYRVGGLPAGRYVVAAGRSPAVTARVSLRAGDDINGVNLVLDGARQERDEEIERSRYRALDRFGSAVLQGRIIGDSGEPLAGARVRLMRHGMNVRTGRTDPNGHYSLRGIPEGRYTLQATNAGYMAVEYGQRRSTEAGRTLHLRNDETVRGVEFVLPRGGVVTGTVVDEHGEAVEGAVLNALQVRFVVDRMMAQQVPGVRERRSDDRGQYRLCGLLPGTYLITASVDAAVSGGARGKSHGYARSYYPGTANIGEAWQVHVDVERDVYGAHLVLAPSTTGRISGTVRDSQGRPLRGLMLLTSSWRSHGIATEPRTASLNGTFLLNNVAPGDYVLQATAASDSAEPTDFVAQYVRVVDGDVSLSLTTSPGTTMQGRVFVEGGSGYADRSYSIVPVSADYDRAPQAGRGFIHRTEPSGHVHFAGLHGPIRLLLSGAAPGWYLKSVIINGTDATDVPYNFGFDSRGSANARIHISPHAGTIRGRVVDDRSATISEYTVVVFAADPLKWFPHSRYTKFARPAQDDSFEVTGLPPGNYHMAAVASLDATGEAGDWQNPAVLRRLSAGAQRVMVAEGAVLDVTLPIVTSSPTRH